MPDGVALAGSGSQITVERNGAVLESLDEEGFTDGAHPISATETDQTVALEAGRYVVEIVLVNDNDDTAVYRESVILLSGLTTEIAFAPAAGGFLSASERAALTLVDELEFGVTAGNEGGIVVGELVTDGGGYAIAVTAPNGTGTVSFTLKKPEGHIVTVGGGDGGKVIASAGETLVVFAVDTSTVANTGGPIVFTLTVAEDGKISVDISVRVTVHAFPISSPDPSLTTNSAFLLKNDGTLWAVGYNRYGSFGNGTTIDTRPYTTDTFTQVANSVTAVANYASDTYIIKDDGSLWAAGRNNYNTHTSETSAFEKEFASGAKAVSVYNGILVLMENGDVYARGTNTNGQLGAGTVANVTEWTKVAEGVKQIAKGNIFSLILKNNGEVWGAGKHAALGIGTSGDVAEYASFQKVFENAAAIAVGASHSLILKNDGTLWGAGEAINGKLGNGNINQNPNFNPNVESFTQLKDSNERAISGVSAISGGSQHSLILKTDGSLWGTGFLNNFNCTDGSSELRVGYFTKMVDGGVTKISAQGPQSFIIKNDGTLWAAGNVGMGILGNTAATVCQDFTQITWPQ
ncbi:MAG: hypothetical protein LBG26_05930 [Treponema sp.]|nr:hypothetical protein [Treponema sp.]